ncbi:MAG: hypothetical protein V8S72_09835 [Oscillospiraceae bacterium]
MARTCAAAGARLHLIKPLGFDISDKAVKRWELGLLVSCSIFRYTRILTGTSQKMETVGSILRPPKRRGRTVKPI